jgi:hypothetical protein
MHPMFPYVPYKRIKVHRRHKVSIFTRAVAVAVLFGILIIGMVATWLLMVP